MRSALTLTIRNIEESLSRTVSPGGSIRDCCRRNTIVTTFLILVAGRECGWSSFNYNAVSTKCLVSI